MGIQLQPVVLAGGVEVTPMREMVRGQFELGYGADARYQITGIFESVVYFDDGRVFKAEPDGAAMLSHEEIIANPAWLLTFQQISEAMHQKRAQSVAGTV